MIIELAHFFNTTPNVLLNFDSSTEITDANLVKLCKFVKDENIDVDALIEREYRINCVKFKNKPSYDKIKMS